MKSRTVSFLAMVLISALIGGVIATTVDPAHAKSKKVLRAEKFELVDSQGKLRVVFTSSGTDERGTLLRLDGKDGGSLVLVIAPDDEGGGQISFYNTKGQRVLNLQESRDLAQTRRPASRGAEPPGQKGSEMVDKGGNVDVWDEIVRLSHEIDELKKRMR